MVVTNPDEPSKRKRAVLFRLSAFAERSFARCRILGQRDLGVTSTAHPSVELLCLIVPSSCEAPPTPVRSESTTIRYVDHTADGELDTCSGEPASYGCRSHQLFDSRTGSALARKNTKRFVPHFLFRIPETPNDRTHTHTMPTCMTTALLAALSQTAARLPVEGEDGVFSSRRLTLPEMALREAITSILMRAVETWLSSTVSDPRRIASNQSLCRSVQTSRATDCRHRS